MDTKNILRKADCFLNHTILKRFGDKPSLLILAFHSILEDGLKESRANIDPYANHGITDSVFRSCVDYFYCKGYTFISPVDILKGLYPDKPYIMITFDDGYANNSRALPVLHEYKIPAVFFITAENVRINQSFWWDIAWRKRKEQGWIDQRILKEQDSLKQKTAEAIDAYINESFGTQAFSPQSAHDRPFTPDELRAFSQDEFVHIGNHAFRHALSLAYTPEQWSKQISQAQEYLASLTGYDPLIFAYPDGYWDDAGVSALRACGIPLAVTVDWRKNYLPLEETGDGLLKLARFVLNGHQDVVLQCRLFRCDFSVYGMLKRFVG